VSKKGTNEEKYDMAKKMYEKKDYVRALPLFEDLLAVYRGKEKSEEIYFYYCYSYFGLGQYELAAFHFKNFTEAYYNSKKMEECSFRYTECLYLDALPYFLDQTNTIKAISEIQLFLNLYPNSTYKDDCNKHIDELRQNLKKKAYETSMLFFKLGDYLAAIYSFKNAIREFPDIENKEEIEYMIINSSYLYAKNSIEEKKEERFKAVFEEYKEFTRNNKPGSTYYAEATSLNEKAKVDLEKHYKLNNIHKK
jgi:outer membrane protein assembly factor BamD